MGGREKCSVRSKQSQSSFSLRDPLCSDFVLSMCAHLVEPFSGDSVACTDVPRLVHQPLQAEGLGHFHAGHCVPANPRVISRFIKSHLLSILLAKKRIGSRLAWMSGCCKKLQSHLVHFQLQPTPSLPLSIPIVYTSTTWSNMSNSSLATTILSRSLESTTKMMPW